MTLSLPQIEALRYASRRHLFAADVNGGDGNRRRTFRSLFKLKMIDWDPACHGRVILTTAGRSQLRRAHEKKITSELRAARAAGSAKEEP